MITKYNFQVGLIKTASQSKIFFTKTSIKHSAKLLCIYINHIRGFLHLCMRLVQLKEEELAFDWNLNSVLSLVVYETVQLMVSTSMLTQPAQNRFSPLFVFRQLQLSRYSDYSPNSMSVDLFQVSWTHMCRLTEETISSVYIKKWLSDFRKCF